MEATEGSVVMLMNFSRLQLQGGPQQLHRKATDVLTISDGCCCCCSLTKSCPKSLQMVTAAMELKDAYSLDGKL